MECLFILIMIFLYLCDYDSYIGEDCIEIFVEELMAAYEDNSKKLNYYFKNLKLN